MPSNGQGRNLSHIVGGNLRAARETLGVTQRDLALRLAALDGNNKTDGQRISDWERGVNRPSDANLIRLAQVLDRDYAWFFVDHDAKAAA